MGGCNETEEKEFAVKPFNTLPLLAQTIVTPVVKRPKAVLKLFFGDVGCMGMLGSCLII